MKLTKLTTADELNELAENIKEISKEIETNKNILCLKISSAKSKGSQEEDLSLDINIKLKIKNKSTDWEELVKVLEGK